MEGVATPERGWLDGGDALTCRVRRGRAEVAGEEVDGGGGGFRTEDRRRGQGRTKLKLKPRWVLSTQVSPPLCRLQADGIEAVC